MNEKENIQEVREFLGHIEPKIGEAAFTEINLTVDALETQLQEEREKVKRLKEMKGIVWEVVATHDLHPVTKYCLEHALKEEPTQKGDK